MRNGIISAAIPSVLFTLTGITGEVITPSDPAYIGLFSVIIALFSFVLFFVIGLPSCIIFCRKLAKKNQLKDNNS